MNTSPTTNAQLIIRLKDPADQQAWSEFLAIYEPLIQRTGRRIGLHGSDLRDATQEVLMHLTQAVHQWREQPRKGSFRSWLVTVARNQMIKVLQRSNMLRGQSPLPNMDLDNRPFGSADSTYFDVEFRRHAFLFVIKKIKGRFTKTTWQAFWASSIDERPAAEVAEFLGMSTGAVYVARSRVMHALQTEIRALVDDQWQALTCDLPCQGPSIEIIRDASHQSEAPNTKAQ